MTGVAGTPETQTGMRTTGLRALLRDRPIIPLVGLLVLLVAAIAVAQPTSVTPSWAGVMIRPARRSRSSPAASTSRSGPWRP